MILVLAMAIGSAQPQSAPSLYDQATAARRAGRNDEAVSLLETASRADPRNSDIWVLYGFALRDTGRTEEARRAFAEALRLAPNYEDARLGLKSLAAPSSARLPILSANGGFTNVSGAEDWREGDLSIFVPLSGSLSVTASGEHSKRFGQTDLLGLVRFDIRHGDSTNVYAAFGATPNADFKPRWQIGMGGTKRISDGRNASVLTFDGIAAQYNDSTIWTANPGVQQYIGDGSVWLTVKMVNVFSGGNHEAGALARVDVETSQRMRLFAGAAKAPDLSEGQVIDTSTIFGGINLRLNSAWEWRLSASREKTDIGTRRTGISTGFSVKIQ